MMKKGSVHPYSGKRHHCWTGGISVHPKGYVHVCRSLVRERYPHAQGYTQKGMFEHRAVMSNHLKRALYKDETVHHRNGDRADNRLENLELRAGKHGPGQTTQDLVAWAKEILRRYD